MGRSRGKEKATKFLGYMGADGFYLRIYEDLLKSQAFCTLSPHAQAVLIDMYRYYTSASNGDRERIEDTGFEYTYGMCRVRVSDGRFYRTFIPVILRHGFFEAPPRLRKIKVGGARRFIPSREWQRYTPTQRECRELAQFQARKEAKHAEDRMRLVDWRAKGKTESGAPEVSARMT